MALLVPLNLPPFLSSLQTSAERFVAGSRSVMQKGVEETNKPSFTTRCEKEPPE